LAKDQSLRAKDLLSLISMLKSAQNGEIRLFFILNLENFVLTSFFLFDHFKEN